MCSNSTDREINLEEVNCALEDSKRYKSHELTIGLLTTNTATTLFTLPHNIVITLGGM